MNFAPSAPLSQVMEYMTTTAMAVIWETRAGFNLTGEPFDRFFQMYLHQDLGSTRWNPSIVLEDGNPPVAMQLQKEKNVANLTVELPRGTSFFGNARALYAFYDRKLLRCSRDFQERVYPMLSVGSGKMQIAFSDLPDFCSCVLPGGEGSDCCRGPKRTSGGLFPR